MKITTGLPYIALLIAIAFPHSELQAQLARGTNDNRVLLAVVDSVPIATARAMIVRRSGESPLVVLDRNHADSETLNMALALLSKLETTPLEHGRQQVVPIQGGLARSEVSPKRAAFLNAQLKAINARPIGSLGTLGRGQHIQFANERSERRL